MKPGKVIGSVTFSQHAAGVTGGRWLLVSPMGHSELSGENTTGFSNASSPVVYDRLGASLDDTILYVEGAEAMAPFGNGVPLDALSVAILDTVCYRQPEQ